MARWLAAIASLLIVTTWTPAVNSLGLTRVERESLDRGDVVVLDVLPPGPRLLHAQGGTPLGVVRARAADVWRVLIDYPRHSGLYPRVTSAEVLEADPSHALVRYSVGVGPFTFGFHVENYPYAAQRRLEWHLATQQAN